ncbi:MAG: glycosyltransferase family 2 protein [Bacteroidales bacterium]|nr:glycosyltransferase family 2 protein [Bacteroidales bacterium]MBN2698114.1 glycosyltransferase family 2 protein [Bacteroidales bacterium]
MKLSIVIPAFNEEKNIALLYHELEALKLAGEYMLEIIFVDDGSRDGTFGKIKEISKDDERVSGIRFSRNFGHQTALLAGLKEAKGDLILMMDCDGQHPVNLIPGLVGKIREGYDIVNTIRMDTKRVGFFKKLSSKLFYFFFNLLSEVHIEPSAADFRIMTRKALDAYLQIDEQDQFVRGLISWMGFKQTSIAYSADERKFGASGYSLRKMRKFAMDGLTSFSAKPLRLSTTLGFIIIFFGIIYSIYAIVMFFIGRANPGWTSLLISILLIGGVQLFSLGIIGEYIARIYRETKKRPHFFIEERC